MGHTIHDEPEMINNYYDPKERRKLQPGMVIAIEPFISEKERYVVAVSYTHLDVYKRQVII